MSKHTLGPWTVESDGTSVTMGEQVCIVAPGRDHDSHDTVKANARLIAAAPDLLEACQWFMAQLNAGVLVRDISKDGEPDWHRRMLAFTMQLGKTNTAIAKAEGGAE